MKKKLLALLVLPMIFGCQVANDVQQGVAQAPSDFWAEVREVLSFLVNTVLQAVGAWLHGLLGI